MQAAQQLWDRYRLRLLDLATRRLSGAAKRVADEEDVAQNVFIGLCRGAKAGRLDDIKNRDDLWWLLLSMTKRKAADVVRHESAKKRGGGNVHGEPVAFGGSEADVAHWLDHLIGDDPTPDVLVILEEENRRLLGLLRDDRLRKIAVSRIEGYTVGEIATELAISTRSVERKLKLIRDQWTKELVSAERGANSN